MSDTQRRARQAEQELQETELAFATVRAGYVDTILRASDADAAWNGVLAVRALDDARKKLMNVRDTAAMEKKHSE